MVLLVRNGDGDGERKRKKENGGESERIMMSHD